MDGCSEKIGGPNKTVEIYESKFGRRKYHRGHLLRVIGCLAVLNENPAEHFLFPYRRESPTHWLPLYMTGSNQAPRSSVATGVRTTISILRVARIALRTTASSSWILTPGPTPIPSRARRVASRLSSVNTTARKTTNTVCHTTCSRRGARHEACHLTYNSFNSSRTPIGLSAVFLAPLIAPRDVAAVVPVIFRHLRYQVRPSSILIIFRLELWSIFFIAWYHRSCIYGNSFHRTSTCMHARKSRLLLRHCFYARNIRLLYVIVTSH